MLKENQERNDVYLIAKLQEHQHGEDLRDGSNAVHGVDGGCGRSG